MKERDYFNELERFGASDRFAPLHVEVQDREVRAGHGKYRFDAVLKVSWGERWVELWAEHKASPSLLIAQRALETLAAHLDKDERWRSLLLLDYLSSDMQRLLREAGASGMDLCGNYMIQTPEFLALRVDQPNLYPSSRPIQNIYAGQSALVSRLALTLPTLPVRLDDWSTEIAARGGQLSISTISKVLAALRDDLMLSSSRSTPRLLQPAKLLHKLAAAYEPPTARRTLKVKLPDDEASRAALLRERLGDDLVWSGDTSATLYGGGMAPTVARLYTTTRLDEQAWRDLSNARFYNCELHEIDDPPAFFDRCELWSSPVQAYLEMSNGDARAKELTRELERYILNGRLVD
jgi:hypothetical protein